MPAGRKPRKAELSRRRAGEEPRVDLGTVVEALRPYVPEMIRTLGVAAASGDVKAAIAGLDLIVRYLSGSNAVKGQELLEAIREIRETHGSGNP